MMDFVIKYWLEVVFGLALTGLGWGYKELRKRQKAEKKRQDAVEEGMLALLHNQLFQTGMAYISRGWVTSSEMENYERMYVAYHDGLDGNGTGTQIYERVMELPMKEGE